MTMGILILRITSLAQSDTEASFLVIAAATMAGAVIAAATPWHLTASIDDFWRRGVASAIATMLGFILAAVSAPIDMFGGVVGLLVFLVLLAGASAISFRGAVSSVE
jgi:hypothetical protein